MRRKDSCTGLALASVYAIMMDVRYPGREGITPPGSEMKRKRD